MELIKVQAYAEIFEKTFARATPPYTGINIMKVRNENMEKLLENLRVQGEYCVKLGMTLAGLTVREYDSYNTVLWSWHYPKSFTGFEDPRYAEDNRLISEKLAPEWFSLIEDYDWYLIEEEAKDFPNDRGSLFRQIPHSDA
ncbi:MAG: hypothetical protein ABJK25_18925 [Halieaceae bacterium]